MSQPKLTKWEWDWIHRLEDPNKRKARGQLKKGNGYCCLGHACIIEKLSLSDSDGMINLSDVNFNYKKIRLRDNNGRIDKDKVSDKWKKKLEKMGIRIDFDLYLADMNDGNKNEFNKGDKTGLSHKQIAQFIRENREAVFNVE